MSAITMEMMNDEQLNKSARQAIWDISFILSSGSVKNESRLVLAAYLLSQIATYNNPLDFNYKALLSEQWNIGEDSAIAISELITEEEWQKLLPLVTKYSPEVFGLAALTCDFSSLRRDLTSGFRSIGDEATPDSIIKLSQKILNIKPDDRVADLCCGYGTFLYLSALIEPSAHFSGYEISTSNKMISTIRAALVSDSIDIILQDVFELAEKDPQPRFEKVFSNYPFKMPLRFLGNGAKYLEKLAGKYPGVSKATSSDWVFNFLICELLSDGGKAVGIMTNGSTWNGIDTPMRKIFVENGFIESVISLPGRMFSSTSIPTSLIVFSRGNSKVRIVDASKICQQGRRYNEFNEEDIDTIISAINTDSEYSRVIELEELRKNEYTLSLSRYLKEDITFAHATRFEEVIKSISRGAPCTASQLDEMASDGVTNMQYLMLANIQNGMIDDKLPYLSHIDPKFEKYCLKNQDLILSKNGYPYKIAVANVKKDQRILANGNLYIIEVDQDKVDPYYLKAFFESEQGIAVLKSITVGATIPNIGVDKLKKVEIPIPSLVEQRKIAKRYQTILDEIAVYKIKLEKAMNRLHHVFDEESEG